SLEEAQKYALENNRTLKNASLDVMKSQASHWQSVARMLPQNSAKADYSNYCGYEMNFGMMAIPMNPYGTLGVTASMAFSGAQVVAVQISKIAQRMSDISLKMTEQETKDQVKTLYYSALVMEQTVELLKRNLDNMKELYKYTEESVKVGIAEQTDADQLLIQLSTMRTSIFSSATSLEMVYNSLRLQLGVDVNTEIVLTQSIDDLLNADAAFALVSEEFILDNNYNYQLLKENTNLSKKQLNAQKWSTGPQLSAYYNYSAKTYFGKDEGMNMTPPNMVGVSVSVPLFSSLGKNKAIQAAKYDYEKQLNSMKETEDALRIQHRQLCYNLETALQTYDTQKQNIDVTQRVFNNISNKYEVGAAASLDLTNAGTNLISAQSSYVQALMELVNAQIALEQLLNK
ncbi:MAG: TolC family protein, partial [Bacteroidales bacterium]|nr:TolC family protein [Bacteroidales bacterium]